MAKGKKTSGALPIAPWIFLTDSTLAVALAQRIPKAHLLSSCDQDVEETIISISSDDVEDVVFVLTCSKATGALEFYQAVADKYRTAAIGRGCNFVSVNVKEAPKEGKDALQSQMSGSGWGTNHIHICTGLPTVKQTVDMTYGQLLKILAPAETVHILPDGDLQVKKSKSFSNFEYCPLNRVNYREKDAKIQCVCLITSKPEVVPDKGTRAICFTVADKSGQARFFFQYRGAESKYTWDWVLKLQPGEIKHLPIARMVKLTEPKRVTVAKAPFRAVGAVLTRSGKTASRFGGGLLRAGKVIGWGTRSEWVDERDVVVDRDGRIRKLDRNDHAFDGNKEGKTDKTDNDVVVREKGGSSIWNDDESLASTTFAEPPVNEKQMV